MGKRSAVVGLLLGNMGSMRRETRPSMQREDQPTMATKLEQIAVKARREPSLRFTSLIHHITRERVLKNLQQIPKHSAAVSAPTSFSSKSSGANIDIYLCADGLGLLPSSPLCRKVPSSSADGEDCVGQGGIIADSTCTCGGAPGPCVPPVRGTSWA